MSFIAAAIIGGGAALGGAYLASRSADKASDKASAAGAASLEFERQKYDDWRETYGDLETNLSDYYNSLTPDFYAARGLEAFQTEHQSALEKVRTTLAQRGIQGSGIAAATEISFAQDKAEQRATIKANAPSMAAEEKRQFLQVGLGQNPGASYSSALINRANNAASAAESAQEAAGKAMSTGIRVAGSALSDYVGSRQPSPQYDVGSSSQVLYNDYSGVV